MSGVYSGSYNSALTLSAAITNVTISGRVDALGTTGSIKYGYTVSAAAFGPADGSFTVENSGLLTSPTFSLFDFGILLEAPGRVDNTGTIIESNGIGIYGTTGYVTNSGLISLPTLGAGIYLAGAGTVLNAGTISAGNGNGVYMSHAGGTLAGFVSNAASGTISGNVGVFLPTPGTVINAGTIIGSFLGAVVDGKGGYIGNTGSIISGGDAVYLNGSDIIVNGASNVTNAVILGRGLAGIYSVPFNAANIGTVVNFGTVSGSDDGIVLASGTVINGTALDTSAMVSGIQIDFGTDLVENFGTIQNGQIIPALNVFGSGTVINGASNDTAALIESGAGKNIYLGQNETLTNYGTILGGATDGVFALSGLFSNASTGVLIGGTWGAQVAELGSETVTNAGLIEGTIGLAAAAPYPANDSFNDVFRNSGTIASLLGIFGTAVAFSNGNDLLVDDPGAVFIGTVSGGAGNNTLDFGAGTGTIIGIGAQFIQFGSIAFDPGATWLAEGNAAGLASGQTISGFAPGDTIILNGPIETSYNYVSNAGLELTIGTSIVTIGITGPFDTSDFSVTTSPDNTTISLTASAPCFAEGTKILTQTGEIKVEDLKPGDRLILATGETSAITWIGKRSDLVRTQLSGYTPIIWLGHRHIDCRRHPKPQDVWPIRIMAGAFGAGMPDRDLWLSPDHAVFAEGVLIPIRYLINGTTIVQEARDEVTYWHVELAQHDVLMAEGLPCESYLDTGTRSCFANGGAILQLHPDFGGGVNCEAVWEALGCAQLRIEGPAVQRVVAGLRRRARELGFAKKIRKCRSSAVPRGKFNSDLAELIHPAWYLAENQDVAAAGADATEHYTNHGRFEGRRPCPEVDLFRALGLIDPGSFVFTMPDVITAGVDPVEHFAAIGWTERRQPNPYFDTEWYLDTHDVPAGMNPLLHYVLFGENQGLPPSRHFDPAWYRARYDIKPTASPLAHYLMHRRTQRFSPLPSFDVVAYRRAHAATMLQGRDPYAHFLAVGQFATAGAEQVASMAA